VEDFFFGESDKAEPSCGYGEFGVSADEVVGAGVFCLHGVEDCLDDVGGIAGMGYDHVAHEAEESAVVPEHG